MSLLTCTNYFLLSSKLVNFFVQSNSVYKSVKVDICLSILNYPKFNWE